MSQGSRWRDMSTVSHFSPKVSFRTRTRLSSTLGHQLYGVPTLKALRDKRWKYIIKQTTINTGKTKIPLSPDVQKFVFLQLHINLKLLLSIRNAVIFSMLIGLYFVHTPMGTAITKKKKYLFSKRILS